MLSGTFFSKLDLLLLFGASWPVHLIDQGMRVMTHRRAPSVPLCCKFEVGFVGQLTLLKMNLPIKSWWPLGKLVKIPFVRLQSSVADPGLKVTSPSFPLRPRQSRHHISAVGSVTLIRHSIFSGWFLLADSEIKKDDWKICSYGPKIFLCSD